ncbi:preprotein translocase subunit SecA [Patescibacteria group bacterium]|nr:preprotein translocase subunit SecA [Patescibacteria group bacterium]
MKFLEKITGDPNKKTLKLILPIVEKINALEPELEKLSIDELKGKTQEFKKRLSGGETLDDILVEAYAVVREASKRTTGMRHFDVQMIGGIAMHRGMISEMRTGEGKTLVATLPVYLNALEGKGAHLITVNDYLAKRDAVWMGQIYDFLGMSVGIIQNQRVSFVYDSTATRQHDNTTTLSELGEGGEIDKERDETGSFKIEDEYLRPASRQEAYRCDITYGTNNEYGFDYLRDNMVQNLGEMVMRPGSEMHYAIIDEIDSILIDEARTPLIISAPAGEAADQYYHFAKLVKQLSEETDYNLDEKLRSATLTEEGIAKFEKWLGVDNIYVEGGIRLVHHIEQALKAEVLFKRDKDYIVDSGEVVIIDEFTGRKMPGRRYSEGLHQAIEAKENVDIQKESQTLATITFQNLFRMYKKLSGMTGTAETEKEEFFRIYNLDVLIVPTNKPDARKDNQDRIYKNTRGKYKAIADKIKECRAKNQPMLIGTISVEKNEDLSNYLNENGVEHEILNAKNHEREGEIVAQAGRAGAITLATNMAGRGVDIKLGGNPIILENQKKVIDAGGLFVLGTERHESRRIDNQLRGRCARQGDPGETQFFVSTDDDLMRIFAGDRMKNVMERLKVPDDMPIEQKMISKMLETAQTKVEGHNYDIRKHLLQYDDILNKQRAIMYKRRRHILELESVSTPMQIGLAPDKVDELGAEEGSNQEEEKQYTSYKEMILDLIEQEIEFVVTFHTNPQSGASADGSPESKGEWNMKEIFETTRTIFPFSTEEKEKLLSMGKSGEGKFEDVSERDNIIKFLLSKASQEYKNIEDKIKQASTDIAPEGEQEDAGERGMRQIEKNILLRSIDTLWVDYLVEIDHVRKSIGLRGYAQRDPLIEYKKETYHMFNQLLASIQREVVYAFFKVGIGLQLAPTIMANDKMTLSGAKKDMSAQGAHNSKKPRDDEGKKVGRNDECPCGSGKKYKKCCGK